MKRNTKAVLASVCAGVAAMAFGRGAAAATATWNGSSGNLWSTTANWTGSQPGGADVVFNATGASGAATTVSNVDDILSRTINSLWYQQQSNAGQFHTTQINDGATLRIAGLNSTAGLTANTALFVGTGADGGANVTVTTTFLDAPGGGAGGTLFIDSASGDIGIVQTSGTAGGTKRATLDLSGLSFFNATMGDLNIGVGTTTTGGLARGAGDLFLAKNNTINANSITVSSNPNGAVGLASHLFLGPSNIINTSLITVGGRKAPSGTAMGFKSGINGGVLQIRGPGGAGRADLNIAGVPTTGVADSQTIGVLDLSSGTTGGSGSADAQIGTLLVGRASNSSSSTNATGTLTFDAGKFDVNLATIGSDNPGATGNGSGVGTGNLNVKSTATTAGLFIVNSQFTLGQKTGTALGANGVGNLVVTGTGATVKSAVAIADGGGTSSINVNTGGTLQARGLSSIDTFTVSNGTMVVDLGSGGIPASPWGTVGALTTSGTNTLQLDYTSGLTTGSFTALSFTSGSSNFALAPKLPARVAANLTNNANSVTINVTSADQPRWIGNVNGDWDIENGALGTANWKLVNAGSATKYQEDLATYNTTDKVIFDDNATGTTNVNITTTVAPNRMIVNNSLLDYTFSGTGKITGAGGIVKQGTRTLTISNSGGNDFTGGMDIQGGTLSIGADEVIPNATALTLAASTTLDLTTHTETVREVNLTGGTITGTTGSLIAFVNAQGGNINGNLSGNSAISKSTTGLVIISGNNNNYTGATIVRDLSTPVGGILRITSNNALGATGATSGTSITGGHDLSQLELANNITTAEPITIRGRTGGATPNLTASIVNHSDNNTITGQISLETDGSAYTIQSDSGKLTVGDIVNVTGNTTARTLYLTGAADGEVTGQIKASSGANAVTLDKRGAGTWTLSNTNSYTGNTVVENGKLVFNATNSTATLDVQSGTSAEVSHSASAYKVLSVNKLTQTSSRLDLKNNRMIDATDSVSTLSAAVKQGMGTITGGVPAWDGNGIVTTEPNAGAPQVTTLAVAAASDVKGIASSATDTWSGQTVHGSDTLVMYTYAGDANLSGKIDADDYFRIDSNYNKSGTATGFFNGDFNYDGQINGDDYFLIDSNHTNPLGTFAPGSLPPGGISGVSAVPEPASIGLLGLAAVGLFRRKRRM